MTLAYFKQLLSFDSTSGKEREVAEWLAETVPGLFPEGDRPTVERQEVGDGTLNLLFSWGEPRVVFCSHMDTVPPYIPPAFTADEVLGRGSCDAKGQIFAMLRACLQLAEKGCSDFALLLLSGEETGSWGAKAFAKTGFRASYLIVGEPTEGLPVSASKGTKSYGLRFCGEAFHSGYPQYGVSAVNRFIDFVNLLKAKDFGQDPVLGETSWNIGELRSDNPQNILSPELSCRLYFRTTFVSDAAVQDWMAAAPALVPGLEVTPRGGDTPARYLVPEGFPSAPVSFGSDAPHLTNFREKLICGPGSVRVAHRPDEHLRLQDLDAAVERYVALYHSLIAR